MGTEKDHRWHYKNPGSPGYDFLLLSIGFLLGVLVCTSMAGH
jgi:hypothetical protein